MSDLSQALKEAQDWARAALEAHNRVTAERDEALMTSKEAVMRMHEVGHELTRQCEQRDAKIETLMRTCFDEANRLANHCSDSAAFRAEQVLYAAANDAKAYLDRIRAIKLQPAP